MSGRGRLVIVALVFLAGCAAAPAPPVVFPMYLCALGRVEGGVPAMLCKPVMETP